MRRLLRGVWAAGTMVAASMLLLSPPATATPRMISLAFNSQAQNPQQIGADIFREKLMALPGKRFVVDQRVGNALGSENTVINATRSGAVDVAVISGGVTSGAVPDMS